MQKQCLKNDFCLALCCALGVTIVAGVVFWLDSDSVALTSETAYQRAEDSLGRFCLESGLNCDMKLIDAAAPISSSVDGKERWDFKFYSPESGQVSVKVQDDGNVEVHSELQAKPTAFAPGELKDR